jgi:predicted permease
VDLRLALRSLARQPGSTAAVVGILAVGIGIGTGVFSALNEALLRPPAAVADPAGLVLLERHSPDRGIQGFTLRGFTEYRDRVRSFSGMAAARSAPLLLGEAGEVMPVAGMLVTEGYLPLLGVRLAAGRHFLPEEELRVGAPPAAILSHRLWRDRFGRDPAVVGAAVQLNGAPVTVVGVAAPGFEGLDVAERVDVWLPLGLEGLARPLFPVIGTDLFPTLGSVARLAPGVSLPRAARELEAIAAEVEPGSGSPGETRVVLVGGAGRSGAAWRRFVLSWSLPLTAAAGLLLALVVVNAGGILLARSVARRRETAVRLALGAGPWRPARQFLVQALVLSVPAAVAGLLLSVRVGGLIERAVPGLRLAIDHRVAGFATIVAVAACSAAALAPVLDAARRDPGRDLREQAGTRPPRAWRALVAGQVALSLVLVTMAAVLVRGVLAESRADVGFDTDRVLLAELDLRLAGYTPEQAMPCGIR